MRLRWVTEVDELDIGAFLNDGRQLLGREARADLDDVRMGGEGRGRVSELADNPVVADPGQAQLGFRGGSWIADENDVAARRQDIAGPLGEAALQSDVHGAVNVTGGEVGGLTAIEEHSPGGVPLEYLVESQLRGRVVVEQRT